MGDRTPKAKEKARKQQLMQKDRQQAARAARQPRRHEEGGTATLPAPDEQLPPS